MNSVGIQLVGGPADGKLLVIQGDPANPPHVYDGLMYEMGRRRLIYRREDGRSLLRMCTPGADGPPWRYLYDGDRSVTSVEPPAERWEDRYHQAAAELREARGETRIARSTWYGADAQCDRETAEVVDAILPAVMAVRDADLAQAQQRAEKAEALLRDLADPDPCVHDHHGGCQAHGYLSLEPGERCPHAEAKELLAALNPSAPEETDRA